MSSGAAVGLDSESAGFVGIALCIASTLLVSSVALMFGPDGFFSSRDISLGGIGNGGRCTRLPEFEYPRMQPTGFCAPVDFAKFLTG